MLLSPLSLLFVFCRVLVGGLCDVCVRPTDVVATDDVVAAIVFGDGGYDSCVDDSGWPSSSSVVLSL